MQAFLVERLVKEILGLKKQGQILKKAIKDMPGICLTRFKRPGRIVSLTRSSLYYFKTQHLVIAKNLLKCSEVPGSNE